MTILEGLILAVRAKREDPRSIPVKQWLASEITGEELHNRVSAETSPTTNGPMLRYSSTGSVLTTTAVSGGA